MARFFDGDKRAERSLEAVANALGVPVTTFFDDVVVVLGKPSETEEMELLSLFRSMRDPQERQQLLDQLRRFSTRVHPGQSSVR